MVKKHLKHVVDPRSHSVGRQVTVESHHARPYRKRHVGLFILSLAGFIVLGAMLMQYRDQVNWGLASSSNFVSDLFSSNQSYDLNVSSSYGFSLKFNQREFYASAFDGASARLIIGSELSVQRPYKIVRITTRSIADGADKSTLTITTHPRYNPDQKSIDKTVLLDAGVDAANLTKVNTENVRIDGESFTKIKWETSSKASVAGLKSRFVTYNGFVQGNFVTIVATLGVSSFDGIELYENVINSIHFSAPVAKSTDIRPEANSSSGSLSLLDSLTNTQLVSAATTQSAAAASEKVSALYSPAVVKIYNAYCMDIRLDGVSFVNNVCDGVAGSGFFVSSDGYIATNGHVAVAKPLDIAIYWAVYAYSKGDSRYLSALVNASQFKSSSVSPTASDEAKFAAVLDALYGIDPSRITKTNDVSNILIDVSENIPDVTKLIADTKNRKVYQSDQDVMTAKVVDYNYRLLDGIDGWRASDVALLKVDGSNYPTVKLGALTDITQGARLSVIGYPGIASDNGIVDSNKAVATLTTGTISAIKSVNGSDKKIIETDTTIGHGNSGGPAFDDDGKVVGLATYTVDVSGQGFGTFNYVRDIQDFKDLLNTQKISLTSGDTQDNWEKGIEAFYSAHYSRAITYFDQVQKSYPNHSKVAEFIAAANTRIKNGEDVVDFPVVPAVIALGVLFVGVVVGLFLIISHKRKHNVYKEGLKQGAIKPDLPMQTVNVANQKPVISSAEEPATAPVDEASQSKITDFKLPESVEKSDEPIEADLSQTIESEPAEEVNLEPAENIDGSTEDGNQATIETENKPTRKTSLVVPPERQSGSSGKR